MVVIKKWLNIIVDGNSALGPYWHKIVSEYLEKIIRTFFDNSNGKGAQHTQQELGLVIYNANSDLGLDVQYIPWTKDVNYFLGILSCLAFNGDDQNQHTLVEGLAEALTMFPRPSNTMTTQEYYSGERHCIIIAARDPVPRKMLVTVPEIQGRFIGTQLHTLNADFSTLVEMFVPLAISLSIISPKQHPIFGMIFNMGNNDSLLPNTTISDCKNGQFTILLSRKFKEAHAALHEKKTVDASAKEHVESIRRTNDIRHSIDFDNDHPEDLFSIINTVFGEQTSTEATKDDKLNTSSIVPNSSTSEVGISISPMVISTAPTFIIGEGSSKGVVQEEQGNEGVVRSNIMSKTVGVGVNDPLPRDNPLANNSMFSHSSFQPYPSPPMLPHASSSSSNSHPQVPFQLNGFDPLGRHALGLNSRAHPPPITPQFNPNDFWPPPAPLTYFHYTQIWKGTLKGKIYKNRSSFHQVKAYRKATSPSMLTNDWSSRLDIALYLPQKALHHTILICRGPIDYVFFHLTHFNNLDVFHHLKNKNLCAKIHLPSQILILAPTENKYHYIGTVFPRDTIFVEPV